MSPKKISAVKLPVENPPRPVDAVPAHDQASVEDAASAQQAPAGVQSVEPQHAHLTGANRAQQRTLLHSNVNADHGVRPSGQPLPETQAGQHATGSRGAGEDDQADGKK